MGSMHVFLYIALIAPVTNSVNWSYLFIFSRVGAAVFIKYFRVDSRISKDYIQEAIEAKYNYAITYQFPGPEFNNFQVQ